MEKLKVEHKIVREYTPGELFERERLLFKIEGKLGVNNSWCFLDTEAMRAIVRSWY